MNAPRLKAPPYSRHPEIAHGDLVMIYCGARAWKLCEPDEERPPSVVYPKGHAPSAYAWPVEGRHVLILAMGELRTVTDPLVMELLHQGAEWVMVREGDETTCYDIRARA